MKVPFILFAIASVATDPKHVTAEPTNQCENLSSSRSNCDINAIIKYGGCGTNFEELLTCYKFVKEDCKEVAKSVCTVSQCCFGEFIREVECHTGCQIECSDAAATTIERTSQTLYMPEVCSNLPADDIQDDSSEDKAGDDFISEKAEGDSEDHTNLRCESGAFTAEYTLALGISVMISFFLQIGEGSLNWSATAFMILGMISTFLVLN